MLTYVNGNLFDSTAQVITNTVNCVGVMGKGIAMEFKKRYPALFDAYASRCDSGKMNIGEPWLWEGNNGVQILNFPTKRHWREPSRLEDIESGLKWLVRHYSDLGIYTLAMPALGCGNGGLEWDEVRPLLEKYFAQISDLEVFVYPPRAGASLVGPDDNNHDSTGTSKTKDSIAAAPL